MVEQLQTIAVTLGERSYEVVVGSGLLDQAREQLSKFARNGRLYLVSDEQVWELAGARLQAAMQPLAIVPILVPAGEQSKSWEGLRTVVDSLLAAGIERSDHLIAFGGGVIGDLAGFAAAIIMRGCSFVQVPTTLLAQVDSSVGGKTAIDVARGKNLVGAFHQPALVLVDPSMLDTLPAREIRSGYAEIVKYALIEDADFFAWLEVNGPSVIAGASDARQHAIVTAIAGKARIVEEDERETRGRRALLNLGHTFGHALEVETGYSEHLLHGEAVALGCTLAFDYSHRRGRCSAQDADRVRRHLDRTGLPTTLGEIGLRDAGSRLAARMESDKKRQNDRTMFILANGIGKAYVDDQVDLADVAAFLDSAD